LNDSARQASNNAEDVAAMVRWVKETRGLADLVLVSLHAHEQLGSKDSPAEFIPAFAREMIDSGADLVVGHGPHLLRGLELWLDEGRAILDRFAELSHPFGTEFANEARSVRPG
jgi:poly-gamma-glutamate capsule biosynthesis protein CapA/YwtB (metallophosphatase superfamily)